MFLSDMHVVMLLSVLTGVGGGGERGTATGTNYRGPGPTMLHMVMSLSTVPLSADYTN